MSGIHSGPLQPPALPLSFREEIVPRVFAALSQGWSVALVGLAGSGLSNLLRFLAEPRVAAHYLGPASAETLVVYVEADRWTEPGTFFPALAQAIVAAAHAAEWPRAEQAALRHALEDAPHSRAGLLASPLAEVLQHLCGALGRSVFILFDEFDTALSALPALPLRELRALRDEHKYRLAYGLGLRSDPADLAAARPPEAGFAKFLELFDTNTYPVRPYSAADSHVVLTRKTPGWQPALTADEADALHRVTGGHAKLLIAALTVLETRRHLPWPNVERALLSDPAVVETCRGLWHSLPPGEQLALWRLARDHNDTLSDPELARLRLRGLAVGGPPSVFSSLVEAFVLGQPEPDPPPENQPISRLRDPAANPLW